MTDQNNLRERANSDIMQSLDELVNDKCIGLNSDLIGRLPAALANPDAIDVECCVSCARQMPHVRIELRQQREVPVDAAVGRAGEQEVDYLLAVRFEAKLADHFIVSGLPLLKGDRQPDPLTGNGRAESLGLGGSYGTDDR